ncbi:MAG: hypothetical protein ACI8RD_009325, partial [Bacillariaceae sp.]
DRVQKTSKERGKKKCERIVEKKNENNDADE